MGKDDFSSYRAPTIFKSLLTLIPLRDELRNELKAYEEELDSLRNELSRIRGAASSESLKEKALSSLLTRMNSLIARLVPQTRQYFQLRDSLPTLRKMRKEGLSLTQIRSHVKYIKYIMVPIAAFLILDTALILYLFYKFYYASPFSSVTALFTLFPIILILPVIEILSIFIAGIVSRFMAGLRKEEDKSNIPLACLGAAFLRFLFPIIPWALLLVFSFMKARSFKKMCAVAESLGVKYSVNSLLNSLESDHWFVSKLTQEYSRVDKANVKRLCDDLRRVSRYLDELLSGLSELKASCREYRRIESGDVSAVLSLSRPDLLERMRELEAAINDLRVKLEGVRYSIKLADALMKGIKLDSGLDFKGANSRYGQAVALLSGEPQASAGLPGYLSPSSVGGVGNAVSALQQVMKLNISLALRDALKVRERFKEFSDFSEGLMVSAGGSSVYLDLVLDKVAQVQELYGGLLRFPPALTPAGASEVYGGSVFIGKALRLRFRGVDVRPITRKFRVAGVEVRGIIGVGGFAATLLGVDEVGRSFVIKVPREILESIATGATYSISSKALKAFERELKVLKSLDHVHVIEVIDGGVDAGVPYIKFEFCERGSLRGVLETQGKLPMRDALLIGFQVADVLAYIHSKDVVHRDLKPENILFTREGILKVTDFNIAKVMRTVSQTTSRLSPYTPGYAAPEQIYSDRGKVGPQTDIWALGIILHEMVTGETPYNTWDYEESIKERPHLQDLPPKLGKLVQKMMAPDPTKRPTAQEVRSELLNILFEGPSND